MSIDRRTFIGSGLAAVAAEAIPAFAAPRDPYGALVSGQYAGENQDSLARRWAVPRARFQSVGCAGRLGGLVWDTI
jgi:hypothetical protein